MTIPAPLRKKYGLKGGSRVTFETTPTGFILIPLKANKR
ncbi:MAG: AbrB/MazE/SpoVT family DNA-binding domain-containing protein [Opitutales bacterium]